MDMWQLAEVGNETWGATKDPEKMTDSQEEETKKRDAEEMKKLTLNTKMSCKPELLKRNPVYYDPLAEDGALLAFPLMIDASPPKQMGSYCFAYITREGVKTKDSN